MEMMIYYLLDVKRTVKVDGNDVAFDYINTYYYRNEAMKEAMFLSMDEDVIEVSVHKWFIDKDGNHNHCENGDRDDIPYYFNRWENEALSKRKTEVYGE